MRQSTRAKMLPASVALFVLSASILFATACAHAPNEAAPPAARIGEREQDALLQRAATVALGEQSGCIIVIDPHTGRIRALAGEQVAFRERLPPGSTAKPFATLVALETGVITNDTRLVCQGRYRRDRLNLNCSHQRPLPALSPAAALAHSCNYFHATFGEKTDARSLAEKLTLFGFDRRTNPDDAREANGSIPHDAAPASLATGEAENLRVTPAALVSAYAALVNGGRLLTPRRADADTAFDTHERARIRIDDAHRRTLIDGMRGTVSHGTAAAAELNGIPLYIFGKTGTANTPDDLRPHGWFVGFAADARFADTHAPESIRLAVLVFARPARGADAALISRPIFDEFARINSSAQTRAHQPPTPAQDADSSVTRERRETHVRLRLVREARTIDVPLEDYLFGVLAAEAATESEPEALKAQTIVSRTYAVRNRDRHARAGYDLCDLTHCQRFISVRDENSRPDFYALVRKAIDSTRGQVLRDARGQIAETYFSASCGGRTARISDVWDMPAAPPHLRGNPDPYCAHTAASDEWIDTISREDLLRALRSDPRSDTGARLDDVRITRRDAGGRATHLTLVGERRRTVRAWTFKTIVGRALGWNKIKSTRFHVERDARGFRFRGRGFGHGIGLCQAGAHEMARRGAAHRAILNFYLPGTHVEAFKPDEAIDNLNSVNDTRPPDMRRARYTPGVQVIDAAAVSPPIRAASFHTTAPTRTHDDIPRRTLSGEGVRVFYPARTSEREIEAVIATLEAARADLMRRLSAAGLPAAMLPPLEVVVHPTTADFVRATGQSAWVAASTDGRRINLQPLDVLRRRRVLTTTLRHECAHVAIETLARGQVPRWLTEGLAAHVAGEGRLLTAGTRPLAITDDELERRIRAPRSRAEMRELYAEAYRRTSRLIREEGEARVWRRVAR